MTRRSRRMLLGGVGCSCLVAGLMLWWVGPVKRLSWEGNEVVFYLSDRYGKAMLASYPELELYANEDGGMIHDTYVAMPSTVVFGALLACVFLVGAGMTCWKWSVRAGRKAKEADAMLPHQKSDED